MASHLAGSSARSRLTPDVAEFEPWCSLNILMPAQTLCCVRQRHESKNFIDNLSLDSSTDEPCCSSQLSSFSSFCNLTPFLSSSSSKCLPSTNCGYIAFRTYWWKVTEYIDSSGSCTLIEYFNFMPHCTSTAPHFSFFVFF